MRAHVVANWAAVAGVSLAIWSLGGDGASPQTTSIVIQPALGWVFPGTSLELLKALHLFIRKMAHTAEYGVLGLLTLRATLVTWPISPALGRAIVVGFVLVLAVADESRQANSGFRRGTWSDVFLDLMGACAVLAAVPLLPAHARRTLIPGRD